MHISHPIVPAVKIMEFVFPVIVRTTTIAKLLQSDGRGSLNLLTGFEGRVHRGGRRRDHAAGGRPWLATEPSHGR